MTNNDTTHDAVRRLADAQLEVSRAVSNLANAERDLAFRNDWNGHREALARVNAAHDAYEEALLAYREQRPVARLSNGGDE